MCKAVWGYCNYWLVVRGNGVFTNISGLLIVVLYFTLQWTTWNSDACCCPGSSVLSQRGRWLSRQSFTVARDTKERGHMAETNLQMQPDWSDLKCRMFAPALRAVHLWSDHLGRTLTANLNHLFILLRSSGASGNDSTGGTNRIALWIVGPLAKQLYY